MSSLVDLLIAIALGAVQGLTEFIPVSSSGHLVVFGSLFNASTDFTFDVLLNIGTLGALVWHTRIRLVSILKQILNKDYKLLAVITASTLPAVSVGVFFADFIQGLNDNIAIVATMLALVGVPMLFIASKKNAIKSLDKASPKTLLLVGCAQALALIPGTSRAGITIMAGLFLGLNRKVAAEWSFLLAIPVIAGATLKTLLSLEGQQLLHDNFSLVVAGNIASFAVGMVAISALLKILQAKSLRPFGVYRLGLASVLFFLLAIGQI